MRVLMSGSGGLIGSAVAAALVNTGDTVIRLVRSRTHLSDPAVYWNPGAGELDRERLAAAGHFDAAINLSGENLASGRWTASRKRRIRSSRIASTDFLCALLADLDDRPAVLLSASAVGYYGDRGDEPLDESSLPGSGFLAELCRDWEKATKTASGAGIRVVNLRFGMVLSCSGGALSKLLPVFRLGLGGRLGSGRQYLAWIALDDAVAAIRRCLAGESLRGAVNVAAPDQVTNREFTMSLGSVLKRPTLFAVPAAVLRLLLGDMADETLLASTRVQPAKLLDSGFRFAFPSLKGALEHELRATPR